jgi:hypothetical protein
LARVLGQEGLRRAAAETAEDAVGAAFELHHDFFRSDSLREGAVGSDALRGELVEQGEDFFEGVKQLSFLFVLREEDKSEVEQPATIFLEEVALGFEIGGAWGIAFLADQIRAVAVCCPGEVHDLAALDVVADCGHGSGEEDMGAGSSGFIVKIANGEHAIDAIHEVFFLEFEHVHGEFAGEDFAA